LIGCHHIAKALICGLDGSWWAGTDGFNPSAAEIQKIIAGFDDSGAKLRAEGMYIQGTKYLVLRADDTSIYAKQGPGGAAACKANTCMVLSVYVEKMTPGNCNVATEALADYLRDNGY
jgi:profilin